MMSTLSAREAIAVGIIESKPVQIMPTTGFDMFIPVSTAPRRKRLSFAERCRLHPRAGDRIQADAFNSTHFFEVEFVSSPWVFYTKWSTRSDIKEKCKVRLGAWRSTLAAAKIKEMK